MICKLSDIHLSEESKALSYKLLSQRFNFIFTACQKNSGGGGEVTLGNLWKVNCEVWSTVIHTVPLLDICDMYYSLIL